MIQVIGREYFMSDSLSGMAKDMTNEQKKTVIEALEHYIAEYKRIKSIVGGKSAAVSIHKAIDHFSYLNLQQDIAKQITCKKGCWRCCATHVDITEDEAELLAELVKEGVVIDREKLKRQSTANSETWLKQVPQDWKCVFLDKDSGTCNVYEYRPVSCRKLISLSPASNCDPKKPNQRVKRMVTNMVEIIASASMNAVPSGSMAKLLNEKLVK